MDEIDAVRECCGVLWRAVDHCGALWTTAHIFSASLSIPQPPHPPHPPIPHLLLFIHPILLSSLPSLAPKRQQNSSEASKRMVSCLLLQLDALARSALPVIVIGATSFPGNIDASLRCVVGYIHTYYYDTRVYMPVHGV